MKTVTSLEELAQIAAAVPAGTRLFWRVTPSVAKDKRNGASTNYAAGRAEAGISANEWDRDFFSLRESLSHQGFYLYGIGCLHLLTGAPVTDADGEEARGSDNEHLLAAGTLRVVARIPITLNEEILSLKGN
jgi:hypothetical protein